MSFLGILIKANRSGPYSYILKIEKDVPLDQLSLEEYLDTNRAQHRSHNACELIDEDAIDFHGCKFHRFRIKVDNAKGPAARYAYFFRDGNHLVGVQWTFPIETGGELIVPSAIIQVDEGVAINVLPRSNE